jgi:bifunctional non-homologous end joining protein LigD
MPKRSVLRAAVADPAVSRVVVSKPADRRQPDLFEVGFIPPMKPKLAEKPPVGDRWIYEAKFDGYRIQAHVLDGRVRLYTNGGHDWTERLPGIAGDVGGLPVRSAVLDGEAILNDADCLPDFFALHSAMAERSAPGAVFMAFDLLHLDGQDLRSRPLIERRAMLAEVLLPSGPHLHSSEHQAGEGAALFDAACKLGLEGIVAKRADSPYVSGYADSWRKIKNTCVEQFAVTGHVPAGRKGIRTLKVSTLRGEELVPCGWVGAGLGEKACGEIRAALDAGKHVVIDVEHRGWTPAGELRHAVYKGWHAE